MGDEQQRTERTLGKLEAGLDIVSKQVSKIESNLMEMIAAQTALMQEVRHLKDTRTEDKDSAKNAKATIYAVGALVISALGLIAQVFLK